MWHALTSNLDRKAKQYLWLRSSQRFISLTPEQSCRAGVELPHLWPTPHLHYASKCQAETCIWTVPLHFCFLHSARGPKVHPPAEEIASCQKNLWRHMAYGKWTDSAWLLRNLLQTQILRGSACWSKLVPPPKSGMWITIHFLFLAKGWREPLRAVSTNVHTFSVCNPS